MWVHGWKRCGMVVLRAVGASEDEKFPDAHDLVVQLIEPKRDDTQHQITQRQAFRISDPETGQSVVLSFADIGQILQFERETRASRDIPGGGYDDPKGRSTPRGTGAGPVGNAGSRDPARIEIVRLSRWLWAGFGIFVCAIAGLIGLAFQTSWFGSLQAADRGVLAPIAVGLSIVAGCALAGSFALMVSRVRQATAVYDAMSGVRHSVERSKASLDTINRFRESRGAHA